MRCVCSLIVLIATLTAGPTVAQRYWGPDQVPYCAQDLEVEACRTRSLATLIAKIDLPAAETLATQGYVGVRVFRYDAFGTIWPTVSFMSRPITDYRREGVAEARTVEGDGHVAILSHEVWEGGWKEVDGVVDAILNSLPPPPDPVAPSAVAGRSRPIALTCLDPPATIVEVVKDGKATRWWPRACANDPAAAKAYAVAEIVAAAFPACGHFPVERYGRGIGRLRACLQVGGPNPLAAVEVMNILLPNIGGDTTVPYAADRQAADVRMLAIDGRRFEGREAVADAMRAGAFGGRWLRILRAEGHGDVVTVTGQLRSQGLAAPDPVGVTLSWRRSEDGAWRITDWVVEQRARS